MGEKDHSDKALAGSGELSYVPLDVIRRVRHDNGADPIRRAALLADLCRLNTLYMIMSAGSGHIGSSFSAMDVLTWLWTDYLVEPNSHGPDADIYFSSKGHDAPALYALLIALEKLDFELIHRLRRLGGLPGHPDVSTPFIATNTGSLGMGISKAYGMARAKRFADRRGRIVVMTGDGELQEGQIWESLQPCANEGLSEIVIVVDHNKLQSDSAVASVSDLGALEDKFGAFGWEVARADGHDLRRVKRIFAQFDDVHDKPKVLIADTIKGKGVSFMEGLAVGDQTYHFHAGAPTLENYLAAVDEIARRVDGVLLESDQLPIALSRAPLPVRVAPSRPEKLVPAYGDELLQIARNRKDIVVLDGDLLSDCGIEEFKTELPGRFIECGIAEQHMVSAAGGMALEGLLPVVHSFACFLSTRANEHMYNNATERRKIIYTATLGGAIPGGPGHSHQSVRDVSAVGSIPGLTLIEPCSEREARLAIRWAVETNEASTYLRFTNVPLDLPYSLPASYRLDVGQGVTLRAGDDVVLIGYGPVLLSNAWRAAQELEAEGVRAAVINLPWLNRIDDSWTRNTLGKFPGVVTLDNHYRSLGQGVMIAASLARNGIHAAVRSLGLDDVPACGTNAEVLAHHGLDAKSIADAVRSCIQAKSFTG